MQAAVVSRSVVSARGLALATWMLLAPWSAVRAEVIELEATVQAVDVEARTLSITRKTATGTKTMSLEVAKNAGDLSSLKAGDTLTVNYDPNLEIVTRFAVRGGADEKPGASPAAGARKPTERDANICRELFRKLEQEHYLQREIDDDVVRQMFREYLASFDPLKMYLLQEDIDSFQTALRSLPSRLKEGDVALAYQIHDRFRERVEARLPLIEKLISMPHDFTKPESLETDRSEAKWPATDAEAEDLWRKRIKWELLGLKMEKLSPEDAREKLLRRYRGFAKRMGNMSADEILEAYLSALARSFDPQSSYISQESWTNFEIGMKMQLDGIGAQLKSEDGAIVVEQLTPGGAAERDGRLKPKDRIIGVGQDATGPIVDVDDMNLNQAVNLVRGQRGTVVRLKVLPGGQGRPVVYDLVRAKIELKNATVRGEVFEVGDTAAGRKRRVGVIVVPSFYCDTAAMQKGAKDYLSVARDCRKLLEGFRLQNVDSVVIDVRNNGGGALHEVIAVVGLFIDRGRVGQIKNKEGKIEPLDDNDAGTAWDGPLIVLVNKMTGGGAEIFAGAMQDHRRGVVVGDESTTGRAGVVSLVMLDTQQPLGAARITSQCFYRADGAGFQQRGVRSDVELPSVTSKLPGGAKHTEGSIAFDRIPKAGFQPAGGGVPDVARLQRLSQARIAKQDAWKDVIAAVERYEKRRQAKDVSLVEQEFAKVWNEAAQPASGGRGGEAGSRTAIERDYYLDEVLNIAADSAGPLDQNESESEVKPDGT